MSDYDIALDIDPNNFLAHYNRGLLRQQVGDDNRAIEDFDYVLQMEPGNVMALFNRAILLDATGNLRGAIRDYSKVIEQFPNFWTGLSRRASCYRRLGMTGKAEKDEFRILKAQMDKHLGIQNRWSKSKLKEMRKKSDIDPNKYNSLVVEDEEQKEHEYKSEYRGKIQNRKVNIELLPEDFSSSLEPTEAAEYYVTGTRYAKAGDYKDAIGAFTVAIGKDPRMQEAYFNRGLCYIFSGKRKEGLNDLSKAGELGLYSAYSVMNKFNKEKNVH